MELFWQHDREMTLSEITDLARECGFQPTIGTAKTYLQRLVKKGALTYRKVGHKLLYSAAMDESKYQQRWAQSILNEGFGGSLGAFISALTGNAKLTKEEIEELRKFYHE